MLISDLIIEQNHQFVVLNKPAGMPAQPDLTEDKSLQGITEAYCKQDLHIINRLDRPASGLVVMARTPKAATSLHRQFEDKAVEKSYWAVVKKAEIAKEASLVHYVRKGRDKSSICKETDKGAQRAELSYKIISENDNYYLLDIQLITGRFHQIRSQLSAIGCPIKGDGRYGFDRPNKDRSIHLHAHRIVFKHPVSGEKLSFDAPISTEDVVWNSLLENRAK